MVVSNVPKGPLLKTKQNTVDGAKSAQRINSIKTDEYGNAGPCFEFVILN